MDPVTAGALIAAVNAVVSGAGGEAGRRALEALGALSRRVLRRSPCDPGADPAGDPGADPSGDPGADPAGDGEPVAIPYDDPERLRRLAELLVERARQDPELGRDLAAWMSRYGTPAQEVGTVHNSISGDARITGPVIQGRDFQGPISFGPQ
ncbi:hypothetical protein SBI_06723 [Streptomyces bingchenggensis BCW-1]|uniref:Uncharacterized protein n=1 Tax=Streptomyces bingchenggensis (strain BCW-1) TaxID=749414 RepID=D7BXU5_STRBB|nr:MULTISPECIES: hypothetical protein [Streptomyces]ADI09843.1 hypothetical protein SBI_06723 [Streptomyces bingchenggensis BCW-1]